MFRSNSAKAISSLFIDDIATFIVAAIFFLFSSMTFAQAGAGGHDVGRPTPPPPAKDLKATAVSSSGTFTLSWSAGSVSNPYFRIFEDKSSGLGAPSSRTISLNAKSTSIKVSGLTPGSYTYRVGLCTGINGCSISYPTITVTAHKPATPNSISAPSTSQGSVTVSWGTSSGMFDRYELYRRVNSGGWSKVYSGTARSKAFSGLDDGTYQFRVRACYAASNGASCSGYRTSGNHYVALKPATPSGIGTPTRDGDGTFNISWSVPGAIHPTNAPPYTKYPYTLEQRKNSGSWTSLYTGSFMNFAARDLSAGNYQYRLRGCNTQGSYTACGAYKYSSSIGVLLPPAVPHSLNTTSVSSDGKLTLSWAKPSGQVTHYEVKENKLVGIGPDKIRTIDSSITTTSVVVSGLSPGSYLYSVKACNALHCSSSAGTKTVTIDVPSTPATFSVNPQSDTAMTLSWSASQGIFNLYRLYQKFDGGSWTLAYSGSDRSTILSGLKDGVYQFRVQACYVSFQEDRCGAANTSTSHTIIATPKYPTSLTAPSKDYDGSFEVTWTTPDSVHPVNGQPYSHYPHELQQQKNGSSWSTIFNASTLHFRVSGLTDGQYKYRLRGCKKVNGQTKCGSFRESTVVTVIHPPGAAGGLAYQTNSLGSYTLNWTRAAGAVDYYEIEERSEHSNGAWKKIDTATSLVHLVSVHETADYDYRVRACNEAGCGGWSNTLKVPVLFPPTGSPNLSIEKSTRRR